MQEGKTGEEVTYSREDKAISRIWCWAGREEHACKDLGPGPGERARGHSGEGRQKARSRGRRSLARGRRNVSGKPDPLQTGELRALTATRPNPPRRGKTPGVQTRNQSQSKVHGTRGGADEMVQAASFCGWEKRSQVRELKGSADQVRS